MNGPTAIMAASVIFILMAVAVTMLPPAGAESPQTAPPPRFVMACAPCHGFDGIGHDPATPHLAGQNMIYLYNQMIAFRSAARKHPEMNFFSVQMSLEEIQAIAEYYAGLKRR